MRWRELQVSSGLFSAGGPFFSFASIVVWTLALLLVTGRGRAWLAETTRWQWAVAAGTIGVIHGSLLLFGALA